MCVKYDKQIRELRNQINMKAKDIQNQREEVSEMENKASQKQNEIKSLRS